MPSLHFPIKEQDMTQPNDDQPVQTDNREREGIDPAQDVSQDPDVDYSQEEV